jgi:hypothetical protein
VSAKRKDGVDEMFAYMAAYSAANDAPPPFRLIYQNGWVEFRSRNSSAILHRKSLSALVAMTQTLRSRQASPTRY